MLWRRLAVFGGLPSGCTFHTHPKGGVMLMLKRSVSILGGLALAASTLAVTPEPAAGAECVKVATCAATNRWGATLAGMDDVEVNANGCLESWDCVYDDGFTTRHIVLQ